MFKTFESAVFKHLTDQSDITEALAQWNMMPAVFNTNAPPDTDKGWNKKVQYPKIVYALDWRDQPDRIRMGTLGVYLYNLNDNFVDTDVLGERIKERLSGVFFNTEKGVYCATWQNTDSVIYEGNEPVIYGLSITFDVLAFPDQNTYLDPDPVPGINEYLKSVDESFLIIGRDELPDRFVADDPVLFVRSVSLENAGEDSYAARYMNYDCAIHFICKDRTKMLKAMGKFQQQAMLDGELDLLDKSQLLITDHGKNVTINYGNNQLTDGEHNLKTMFRINAVKEETLKSARIKGNIYGRKYKY